MITTLIMLMLLTLIGVSMTNTTSVELLVAGSEKIHQKTFYAADGATEVASELTEQNVMCDAGFTANDNGELLINDDPDNGIRVTNLFFWMNDDDTPGNDPMPANDNRDFFFPDGYEGPSADEGDDAPHTNVTVQGTRFYSAGSAIQMVSGYEPLGTSSANGGGYKKFNIYAQHKGQNNSETIIHIQWRHVFGKKGACLY